MNESNLWLIRSAQNTIHGPYPKQEVIDQLQSLKLELSHELCPGNGYWFFIHEAELVQKHLGVDVPRTLLVGDTEKTQTDVQTSTVLEYDSRAEDRAPPYTPPSGEAATRHQEQQHQIFERAAIWQLIAWILVISIGAVLATVLKILTK